LGSLGLRPGPITAGLLVMRATRIGTPKGGCAARETLSELSLPPLNDTSERFDRWIERVSILISSRFLQDNGSRLSFQQVLRLHARAFYEKLVRWVVDIDPRHGCSRLHDDAGWIHGKA